MGRTKTNNPARPTRLTGSCPGLLLALLGLASVSSIAGAATDLGAVGVVQLDINGCAAQITDALAELGITTALQGRVSGGPVLTGNISNYVPKENEKVEKGVFDVTYWAVMRDDSGAVMSAKSGRENSGSVDEVCADIAEEIADRISFDLQYPK